MPGPSLLLLILVALVAGAWLATAIRATRGAMLARRAAETVVEENARLGALLEAGPAMALIVGADGAIGGPHRLGAALGLSALPARWLELFGAGAPFPAADAASLGAHVADAAAGGTFSITLKPAGSART